MPKQNCFAVRPGSKLRAFDEDWKVAENDTLAMTLLLENARGTQKRVRYTPGQEIFLRWEPQTRRGNA